MAGIPVKQNLLHGEFGKARRRSSWTGAGRSIPETAMKTSIILPQTRAGRILLHLACLIRTRRFHWHIQGIVREFSTEKPA